MQLDNMPIEDLTFFLIVEAQFNPLKDLNKVDIPISIVSGGEHASKIELLHLVLEEITKLYCFMLPFDSLHRMMEVHLIESLVFCVNLFVWLEGASNIVSPLTIVGGIILD